MDECWEVALSMFEAGYRVATHAEAEALVKRQMGDQGQTIMDNVAYDLFVMCQSEARKSKEKADAGWVASF